MRTTYIGESKENYLISKRFKTVKLRLKIHMYSTTKIFLLKLLRKHKKGIGCKNLKLTNFQINNKIRLPSEGMIKILQVGKNAWEQVRQQ